MGTFQGKVNVNIREYFENDGEWFPTKKGITLSSDLWNTLKMLMKDIDLSLIHI